MSNNINFSDAFSKGIKLIRKYPFPSGKRVSLNEYGHAAMTLTLFTVLASLIPVVGYLISLFIYISLLYWGIARFHDVGRSGW